MKRSQHNKLVMLLSSLAIYIVMGSAVVFAEPDLIIGNYTLISSKRVSRVEFEYTYQAEITNAGSSAVDVSAVLTSTGNGASIVEGNLGFGDVLNESMAISTDTFTIRQNRLFKFDRTALVWNITYKSVTSQAIVGFEGGKFEFSNGVTLEFPVGAVTENVEITIEDLPCDLVDPILAAKAYSSHQKRCVAGFSAEPKGLVFQQPITASLPVPSLEQGEIPIQINVDLNNQNYVLGPTEIIYNGLEGMVEMKIHHFSNKVAGFIKKEGETSSPLPTENCEEKTIRVEAKAMDFSAGECQILDDSIEVTFLDCPGSPVFSHTITEISDGCPKDMKLKLDIDSPHLFPVCTELQLKATLTGFNKDDEIVLGPYQIFPYWEKTDPFNFASLDKANGKIIANKPGFVSVNAIVGNISKLELDPANIHFTSQFSLALKTPEGTVVKEGGLLTLFTEILDDDGNRILEDASFQWASSDPKIANVLISDGGITGIIGKKPGKVEITGSYDNGCEIKEATAEITVEEIGDFFVQAKLSDCEWNIAQSNPNSQHITFCELPTYNDPVPLTVRAGYRQPDGQVEWKKNVAISIEQDLLPFQHQQTSQTISLELGVTDESGEFHTFIVDREVEFPIISIKAHVVDTTILGATERQINMRAFTSDICYSDDRFYGLRKAAHGVSIISGDGCPIFIHDRTTCSISLNDFEYKKLSGYTSSSSSTYLQNTYLVRSGDSPPWIQAEWWETLLIIPYDFRLLGSPMTVTVDFTTSASARSNSDSYSPLFPVKFETHSEAGVTWVGGGKAQVINGKASDEDYFYSFGSNVYEINHFNVQGAPYRVISAPFESITFYSTWSEDYDQSVYNWYDYFDHFNSLAIGSPWRVGFNLALQTNSRADVYCPRECLEGKLLPRNNDVTSSASISHQWQGIHKVEIFDISSSDFSWLWASPPYANFPSTLPPKKPLEGYYQFSCSGNQY